MDDDRGLSVLRDCHGRPRTVSRAEADCAGASRSPQAPFTEISVRQRTRHVTRLGRLNSGELPVGQRTRHLPRLASLTSGPWNRNRTHKEDGSTGGQFVDMSAEQSGAYLGRLAGKTTVRGRRGRRHPQQHQA
jgi:hypothetical protein